MTSGFALWPLLALEGWRHGGRPLDRLRNLAWSAVAGVGLAFVLSSAWLLSLPRYVLVLSRCSPSAPG